MTPDDQIQAARPTASALCCAVDREDRNEVARLLLPLDVEQLRAVAIVLAAHCDVPVDEGKRGKEDYDAVVVSRILNGDMNLARKATQAERIQVIQLWPAVTGLSLGELQRRTRWSRVWETAKEHDTNAQHNTNAQHDTEPSNERAA